MSIICLKSDHDIPMKHGMLKFDIQLNASSCVCITGPNGYGKTTFFQYLKKNAITCFKDKTVAFLDQKPLAPLGDLNFSDLSDLTINLFPQYKRDIREWIQGFEFLGLETKPINYLSGGQNQVAKILSTFMKDVDVYVLDEPSKHLDEAKRKFLDQIVSSELRRGKYILVIEHDNNFINKHCDKTLKISRSSDVYTIQ